MGNMSYVRFRNTLQNLNDCYEHLEDKLALLSEEAKARKKLIDLCVDIALEYGCDIDRCVEEEDKP